jgi:hypothetical protein
MCGRPNTTTGGRPPRGEAVNHRRTVWLAESDTRMGGCDSVDTTMPLA